MEPIERVHLIWERLQKTSTAQALTEDAWLILEEESDHVADLLRRPGCPPRIVTALLDAIEAELADVERGPMVLEDLAPEIATTTFTRESIAAWRQMVPAAGFPMNVEPLDPELQSSTFPLMRWLGDGPAPKYRRWWEWLRTVVLRRPAMWRPWSFSDAELKELHDALTAGPVNIEHRSPPCEGHSRRRGPLPPADDL